ncbi:putative beta-glucosidase K, partial [Fusarium oxysporum f. sp. albedinis]
IGPLFLAPLCESYGRKLILGAANAFFTIFQIGCALAPKMTALIIFRFLAGMGGSGCLTLGAGVISDMFETNERGTAMGIFISGPLLGPVIGPLVGGFVVVRLDWRWEFWIVLIVGGALTALYQFFTVETNPHILIRRKVQYLKKTMGRDDLRSCYDDPQQVQVTPRQALIRGLVRPMKLLLLSPLVLPLSIYVAFVYGIMYLLFTTIGEIFKKTYHFSIETTGLVYISLGVGTLIGWAIITLWSDRSVVLMTKANDGVFVPEMRLRITLPFAFVMPITFFWYGWSTYYKVHWMSTILSLIPFQAGVVGAVIPMTTYLVDSYPKYAASSVAALTVLRSIGGMMLPLAGPSMYRALGLGWGNSVLGFLSIGLIPVPWLLYKYGGALRKTERITL